MKLPFSNKQDNPLDLIIEEAVAALATMTVGSKEATEQMKHLSELYALKEKTNPSRRVSPDAVLTVLGSLLGIVIIVAYEHGHVVTTKALSQLPKTK